jgi:hypothetical protein
MIVQHRQLNIEKKYKKIRTEIMNNAGVDKDEVGGASQSVTKRSGQRSPKGGQSSVVLTKVQKTPKRSLSRGSRESRDGGSVLSRESKNSRTSKTSIRSASKGSVSSKGIPKVIKPSTKPSARSKSKPKLTIPKKLDKLSSAESSDQVQVIAYHGNYSSHGQDRPIDASREYSHSYYRTPPFYEGTDGTRQKERREPTTSTALFGSPASRHLGSEDDPGAMRQNLHREDLKRQVRSAEDEVLALKKLYREKMALQVN